MIRKRIAMIAMALLLSVAPVFANMPVIDISAITQAVTGYVQQIKEWNATIQQWKSEFDRIQKAAKGLASGDFTSIVSGLASLTKQMSSWDAFKQMGDDTYMSEALAATSDGSYSLLKLMGNSQLMIRNIDKIYETIEKNIEQVQEEIEKANDTGGALGAIGATGSSILENSSLILKMIENLLKGGGSAIESISSIIGDVGDIFNISPEEYASMYSEMLADSIDASTDGKAQDSDSLLALIEKQLAEVEERKNEITKYSPEEEPTAYAEAVKAAEDAEKLLNEYKEMYDEVVKIEASIRKMRENEEEYQHNKFDERLNKQMREVSLQRTKIENQMQDAVSEGILDGYAYYMGIEEMDREWVHQ